MRCMLKSKIHQATVTGADLFYEGSITIDRDFMDAVNLLPYEQVHVFDITNGSRLITYVIEGKRGSGDIIMNGAAARKVAPGDLVIILGFEYTDDQKATEARPKIIRLDKENRILDRKP